MKLFVTGASGFLGSAALARLVLLPQFERFYLLLRPSRKQSCDDRLATLIEQNFPSELHAAVRAKLVVVPGDLTQPRLGLDDAMYNRLASEIQQILHIGASTNFSLPLPESRRHNVGGTQTILGFAQRCAARSDFVRLEYISTAYVAGTKAGDVTESELERGQTFANPYEQSKYEAEQLVRAACGKIPTAIHRPSIIVGDSRTGYTPHFKILYFPLRILAKGILPFFPANGKATLDVVPVDYVADALTALIQRPESTGQTFHLTAGRGQELPIHRLLDDAARYAGIKIPPRIPPWLFDIMKWRPFRWFVSKNLWDTAGVASPYKAYFRGRSARFDSTKTEAVLAPLGIRVPLWCNYGEPVLSYIRKSQWGRVIVEETMPRSRWKMTPVLERQLKLV